MDVLKDADSCSVDSIITDPPYGLSFMGKRWDYDVPSVEIWKECLRVLKPGGHLLAFAGTRTQHRMAVRIEDAGFEIRDLIAWVYGSGFPKSLDVSKAIDKAAGAEREVVGIDHEWIRRVGQNHGKSGTYTDKCHGSVGPNGGKITAPATPAARQWSGWGTALKPALEPITVARKPLVGTVAENVLRWGTGALNVDGCRIPGVKPQVTQGVNSNASSFRVAKERRISGNPNEGRWPANLIHDGSEELCELLGDAACFFYCAKASKADRDEQNIHPTVKPTDLMRYLCRLVTPPNGIILDPFMGSGSTGKAAIKEGFNFIGIEKNPEYFEIAEKRLSKIQIGLSL